MHAWLCVHGHTAGGGVGVGAGPASVVVAGRLIIPNGKLVLLLVYRARVMRFSSACTCKITGPAQAPRGSPAPRAERLQPVRPSSDDKSRDKTAVADGHSTRLDDR